jgi:tetratricopeptide (TPR) repeat protein
MDSIQNRASIHARFALLLRRTGNLPAALEHAERALDLNPENLAYRVFAAELAMALLEVEKANQIAEAAELYIQMEGNQALTADGKDLSAWVTLQCLRIENALDAGSEVQASKLFTEKLASLDEYPRILAVQARLFARRGDLKNAEEFYQKVVDGRQRYRKPERSGQQFDLKDLLPKEPEYWFAATCVELQKYEEALDVNGRLAESFQYEAQAHQELAKTIVFAVERQRLCQEMHAVAHAPGAYLLGKDYYEKFEKSILKAKKLSESSEPNHWHMRGRAVFHPSAQNVRNLANLSWVQEDAATLIMILRQMNNCQAGAQIIQEVPFHPAVLLQLALCYQDLDAELGVEYARRAVDANPGDPLYHSVLALLAQKAGRLDAALEALENALLPWPQELEWQVWAAHMAEQMAENPVQVDHLEQALNLSPGNAALALALGKAYLESAQAFKAIAVLAKASYVDVENVEIWENLARAYLMTHAAKEALECAQRACSLDAAEQPYLLLLCSQAHFALGERDQAMALCKKALRNDPYFEPAALFLAEMYSSRGSLLEALGAIEEYIARGKASAEALYQQASLVRKVHGPEKAIHLARKLAAQVPEDTRVLSLFARIQSEVGDLSSAEATLYKAIHLQPEDAELNLQMGGIKRSLGQLDQAIHYFSEAVRQAPDNVEAYLELGQTYQDRREDLQALRIYQQAVKVAPMDARPYYHVAIVLRETKDFVGAEAMLRQAAELSPNDLNIRRQLGAIMALNLVHNSEEVNSSL